MTGQADWPFSLSLLSRHVLGRPQLQATLRSDRGCESNSQTMLIKQQAFQITILFEFS